MPLIEKLSQASLNVQESQSKEPVWTGPESNANNGGITQSILSRWLVCRERSCLYLVKGLKQAERFNHRLEFGSMWHLCEEELAASNTMTHAVSWQEKLQQHCCELFKKYPFDRSEVEKWYDCCLLQFPIYVDFWQKHQDSIQRTSILQEQVFHVPYKLPSGRTVWLRGKWDGVEFEQRPERKGIVLFETKTKGDIDEQLIRRQLTFDLQTMFYVTALKTVQEAMDIGKHDDFPWCNSNLISDIIGIHYNVIKRPLSGGKGTIKQHEATLGSKCTKCKGVGKVYAYVCPKCNGACRIGGKPAETREAYMNRLAQYIKDEPQNWFMRWNVPIMSYDIERFKTEFLDNALEQLCWWWDSITGRDAGIDSSWLVKSLNFRMPFGVTSPLLDGGETDLDVYLTTGSTQSLQQVTDLFPELA